MAAAALADMAASPNRTAGWQRKLTGADRVAYGGRRKYGSVETAAVDNGVNKIHCNGYEEHVKLGMAHGEIFAGNNTMASVLFQEETKNSFKVTVEEKAKQKQWKKPIKEDNTERKNHILSNMKVPKNCTVSLIEPRASGIKNVNAKKHNAKPALDDTLQHQTEQETWNDDASKQHRSLRNPDQGLQTSKRTATIDLEVLPRSSKRLRKTTKPLIVEEPRPPPLKLPKLHLVLTRNEILEDWFKITGKKYNGKPKKSSIIQLGLGLCTSLTCPSSIRYLKDH